MTRSKKQMKINKMFKQNALLKPENEELRQEIELLERKVAEKRNEWFQLQRKRFRHKISPSKKRNELVNRPQDIIRDTSARGALKQLELISLITGMEVKSYKVNDHCCIIYHMQNDSEIPIKHGIWIDTKDGVNRITKKSFPLGFNLNAVIEDFENIMTPDCLGAIRKGLMAYYDRLEQFDLLMKFLNIEVQLFKMMDGSHMEFTFMVESEIEDDPDRIEVLLILDYRVYDIRPKSYSFKDIDLPEGVADVLRQQCLVFKKKPLPVAFSEAFIDGVGTYKMVQQLKAPERVVRRPRPPAAAAPTRQDDTYLPDQSEHSDDD